jgi:hypothetical protein
MDVEHMIFRLIVLTGPEAGRRITIEKAPMTIGSAADCRIVIMDDEVARKHATIEHTDKGLFIRDLGSMQKIILNQHEVRESVLRHGDEIELGRTRFLVQAALNAEVDQAQVTPAIGRQYISKGLIVTCSVLFLLFAAAGTCVVMVRHVKSLRAYLNPTLEELLLPADEQPEEQISDFAATNIAVMAPPVLEMATPAPAIVEQVTNTTPAAQPPLPSNELQQVRAELAGIREIVQTLAEKQAATSAPQNWSSSYIPQPESQQEKQPGVPQPNPEPVVKTPVQAEKTASPPPAFQPDVTVPFGTIKIAATEQSKFPKSDEYEEMRSLSIALELESDAHIDSDKVRVKVMFFDKENDSGRIVATKAIVPARPLTIEGDWPAGGQKLVTATYLVPRRQVKDGTTPTSRREQFYGYLVRVYYLDRIIDQSARPDDLATYSAGNVTGR